MTKISDIKKSKLSEKQFKVGKEKAIDLIRKIEKSGDDSWYIHNDKLGMLVGQDDDEHRVFVANLRTIGGMDSGLKALRARMKDMAKEIKDR